MSTEGNEPTAGDEPADAPETPTESSAPPEPPAAPEPPPAAATPPPAAEPPPAREEPAHAGQTAGTNFDFSSVSTPVWISAGGALVLLISVFFNWYTVSVHNFGSASASGWDATDVAKIVALLAVITIAVWCVELFAEQVKLPWPASMIAIVCGVLAVLLVIFRILSKPGGDTLNSSFAKAAGISIGTSFGIYLSLIAAIAVVVGAYMHMNETSA